MGYFLFGFMYTFIHSPDTAEKQMMFPCEQLIS